MVAATRRASAGELEDWLAFFRREAHRISDFPQILFQQAANRPDDERQAIAAQAILRAGRGRPWFRWVNKPPVQEDSVLTLMAQGRVVACAFSPDGTRVVAWSRNELDRFAPDHREVWDAETGTPLPSDSAGALRPPESTRDPTTADGRRNAEIVSGGFSAPDVVLVRDVGSGETVAMVTARAGRLSCCAFSPDGRWLITGSDDRTVRVWDTAVAEPETEVVEGVRGCLFSPDSRRVICSTHFEGYALFDGESGAEIRRVNEGEAMGERPMAWSPDGQRVAFGDRGSITLLNPDMPWGPDDDTDPVRFGGHAWDIHAAQFLPDGRTVVSVGGEWNAGDMKIWDAATGAETVEIDPACQRIHGCAVSPDGALVFIGSRDGSATLWHLGRRARLRECPHPVKGVNCCAFAPDGRSVATGSSDGGVRLWDLRSGALAATLRSSSAAIRACAFSADARRLFVLGYDARLACWSVDDRRRLLMFETDRTAGAMALGAGGRRVGLSGFEGRYWHLETLGLAPDASFATPVWLFGFESSAFDEIPTALCAACGGRHAVPDLVMAAIAEFERQATRDVATTYLDLPDDAWDDPRLRSFCQTCGGAMRFTPFAAARHDVGRA